jgi:hypothetical protein
MIRTHRGSVRGAIVCALALFVSASVVNAQDQPPTPDPVLGPNSVRADPVLGVDAVANQRALTPDQMSAPPVRGPNEVPADLVLAPDAVGDSPALSPEQAQGGPALSPAASDSLAPLPPIYPSR